VVFIPAILLGQAKGVWSSSTVHCGDIRRTLVDMASVEPVVSERRPRWRVRLTDVAVRTYVGDVHHPIDLPDVCCRILHGEAAALPSFEDMIWDS
jgi:hypothetical protein